MLVLRAGFATATELNFLCIKIKQTLHKDIQFYAKLLLAANPKQLRSVVNI